MSDTCQCQVFIGPIILISLIVSSYHTYVVGFCFTVGMSVVKSVLFLFFFNFLFFMTIWSILHTMFQPIATPPKEFKLTEDELDLYNESAEEEKKYVLLEVYDARWFTLKTRTIHGDIRYCKTCKQLKPDRAHHCSSCGVCVLKMDHHCPWLANCIGFSTQKSFILCLFYCTLYCFFFMSTTFTTFSEYWQPATRANSPISVVIGFFVSAILGSITGIFLCFHLMLMSKNTTTIENSSNPSVFLNKNHTFDLGFHRNMTQVLGKHLIMWFIPKFSSQGDGCYFETRKILTRHGSYTSVSGISRSSLRSNFHNAPGYEAHQRSMFFRAYDFDLPPSEKTTQPPRESVLTIDEEIDK